MNNVCDLMKALRPFFGSSLSAFYLYGSAAMDDFRPGWSDIDILVLLDEPPAEELVTLRTRDILPKTAAGEWALREGLCPVEDDLRRALSVRREPMKYKEDPDTRAWLSGLAPAVQRYADTLEKEWVRT